MSRVINFIKKTFTYFVGSVNSGVSEENRSLIWFIIVLFAGTFVYSVFISDKGISKWLLALVKQREQQKEISGYVEMLKQLDMKIEKLSEDKDSLEQFARENFYFSAPDEDVYVVPEDNK